MTTTYTTTLYDTIPAPKVDRTPVYAVTIHGKRRTSLNYALNQRLNFKTGGSFSGHHYFDGVATSIGHGLLNDTERKRLEADLAKGITYVVRSYDTPIAWETSEGVYVVDQKWGPTTGKHKGATWAMTYADFVTESTLRQVRREGVIKFL